MDNPNLVAELYSCPFSISYADARKALRRRTHTWQEFDGHLFDDLERLFESRGDAEVVQEIGKRVGRCSGPLGIRIALDAYRILLFSAALRAQMSHVSATIAIARVLLELSRAWGKTARFQKFLEMGVSNFASEMELPD